MDYNFTLADLFKAYFDCKKHKRYKLAALKFEVNLEKNLLDLYKEIKSGNYKIGTCICFVVTKPKPGEVWAANFRDRIVHHLIYNFISQRFYRKFIHDTYSCIPNKGTLYAAKRLLKFSRSATNNYTKKMFYLKADLSNFFVSIDKNILFELIKKEVHEKWLLEIIHTIIFNDPTKNVYVKSSPEKLKLIPKNKSLFFAQKDKGLPIGNHTSQFFSNIYLNVLDRYVKRNLKCKYYIRYVDDFIIIDNDAKTLNKYFHNIKEFISNSIKAILHPCKKLINKVENGMDFVGYFILPHRLFIRKAIINKIFNIITLWVQKNNRFEYFLLNKLNKTVNSYLGMLVNVTAFVIRRKIALNVCFIIYFNGCLNSRAAFSLLIFV